MPPFLFMTAGELCRFRHDYAIALLIITILELIISLLMPLLILIIDIHYYYAFIYYYIAFISPHYDFSFID